MLVLLLLFGFGTCSVRGDREELCVGSVLGAVAAAWIWYLCCERSREELCDGGACAVERKKQRKGGDREEVRCLCCCC